MSAYTVDGCSDRDYGDYGRNNPGFTREETEFPADACIHELFEAQARRTPDRTAVSFQGQALSYRELDSRANLLAHNLRRLGVGAEVLVGLCALRSLDVAVGVLAILKAGGAYVPLDPAYPKGRLEFMLNDAGIRVLLTQHAVRGRLPPGECERVFLDDDRPGAQEEALAPPSRQAGADNLAYVIYTSGSTGKPKGVAVTHRPMCNLTWWQVYQTPLGQPARTLQLASLSFDVSIQEMFSTWCAGGTLVLVPETIRLDPAALLDFMVRESIERIFLPFSPLQQLAVVAGERHVRSGALREIVTAGEQLRITPELVAWIKTLPGCTLYNQYGPTETHVVITSYALSGDPGHWPALPPLGRPVANVRIHLLDRDQRPVAVGEPGEICVAGVCLARGYLNRPQLTAEHFFADPAGKNGRLYRTGDLARFLPDGNIEFLGRLDHQVKVRGFRIELGEIEAALDRHPGIRQAVAVAREDRPGEKRLVSYVVPGADPAPDASALREFLRERLPEYMLPSAFVVMQSLPMTPSGKVDRKALPAPPEERPRLAQAFVAPRDPAEQRLAAIWSDVLGIQPIGAQDDFFDLGGDSLKATRVLGRVEGAFEVRFPHAWLFEGPTVAQMAERLKTLRAEASPSAMPVPRAVRENGAAPLSYGQEELWSATRLHPDLPIYNEPFAIQIPEGTDARAMERALNALIDRHEILRTGFPAEGGRPLQRIDAHAPLHMEHLDLRQVPESDRAGAAIARAEVEARRPFDLSSPPLLRAVLVQTDDRAFCLYLVFQHIVIDAVSVYEVLLPELWALYKAECEGASISFAPLPLQYADFARWQRAWLQGPVLERNLRYWEERLADAPVLSLPADRPPSALPGRRGAFEPFAMQAELSVRLKELARREGTTLYVVLLAAFLTLLWRYTRQDDLVVGTAESGRSRPELERLIGYFVNTLSIRADLSGNPGFSELLQRVRTWTLEAQTHRDCPLTLLGERLRARGHAGRRPFRVAFVMEPSLPALESGWSVSQLEVQTGTAKFDLTLELEEREGLIGRFEYAIDLFDAATVRRLVGHFRTVLEGVADDPRCRLSEIPLLTAAERHQLLSDWNRTGRDYPRDECIHRLFAAQAARTPDAVALECGARRLSYRQIDERANRLAHHLRSLGVGPDVPVGVYGDRSPETVIAILAVLKAGGAYLPLDPTLPMARLSYMLEDTGARVLLAQRGLPLPPFAGPVLVPEDAPQVVAESTADPAVEVGAEHLAYVMYTSGSTGVPKGVAVPHRAVLRLLCGVDYAELDSRLVTLLMAPLAFDASTFELWAALLHGGRCVVFPDRLPTSQALGQAIAEHGVNTLWLTAALFNSVIDDRPEVLMPVRQLLTGGEALSPAHVRRALACLPGTRLINGYGPTEGTTFTCCHPIPRNLPESAASVPIGRPIANTRVYVLDEHRNPVPVGIPGELFIGGDGLARGYLNRPELTAERFVFCPFEPGERLYRTGDRVRWLPDGNLEFLGRLDDQVKLRGFRIELGEIEAVLATHPAVREAVVLVREHGSGDKRLVAYVVAGRGPELDSGALRGFLKERLPEYMLPAAFVMLESMPMTANGKVDRNALPADATEQLRSGFVGPRDAIEVQIMRIWEQLFARQAIGMRDDFFELGGNSLLALQVADRVKQLFSQEVPVDALWYHGRTIEGLAGMLRNGAGESLWSHAVPIQPHGSSPPLFCPHIAGGHLFFYDNIARHLGADQPVYGLPARGTDGRQPPHDSIEAMAAHGIRLMREVQPHGPYALLGYCSGGLIAYEMSRQLRNDGEEVSLLALLDSIAPGRYLRLPELLRDVDEGGGLRLVQERIYHLLLHPTGLGHLRQFRGLGEAHRWALWSYKPRRYAGRAVLLRPRELSDAGDPSLGWARLVNSLELHTLPGRHGDLVKEPGVRSLATELGRLLA